MPWHLTGFTRAEAELDPAGVASGAIVVVERDQLGGTAWSIASVEISPD